ncbi:MAG TPA: hypothetical protein VK843_16225 [Planctomycetota bacterium]|nr:hypothetical protein [Planctomycetota bacterium]
MKFKTNLLLLCTLLGVPAGASAFQTGFPGQPLSGEEFDMCPWKRTWPTVSTNTMGVAVAGDFTGDYSPDVWQHADGALVLFVNPSHMDVNVVYTGTVSSIARLPGATVLDKSRLLFADYAGVGIIEYTVGATNPITVTSVSIPTGTPTQSWLSVKSLRCCDLDGAYGLDLMAINSAGTYLLRLMSDGQGGYTHAPAIYLGSGATEAFPMIYNTGEAQQFAVLTNAWFFIVQSSGVRSKVIANGSAGHIAKLTQVPSYGTPLPDCVAWWQDLGSGDGQLRLVDSRATLQTPVPLDDLDISAIATGDVDGNGSDDVSLVSSVDQVVYTYFNHRDADTLTINRFEDDCVNSISLEGENMLGIGNTATPLLVDLNFDGMADFFAIDTDDPRAYAIQTLPPRRVLYQQTQAQPHPCFDRADYHAANWLAHNCSVSGTATGVLMLSLNNPWPSITPTADLSGWLLDLVVYRQPADVAQVVQPVEPVARVHYQYNLNNGDYLNWAPAGAVWSFPITIEESAASFHDKFYIVLKPLPPGSSPLAEYITGVTSEDLMNGTHEATTYLKTRPGSWGDSTDFELVEEDCSVASNKKPSGSVPLLRVPPYQPNTVPSVPSATSPPAGIDLSTGQ